MGYQIYRVGPRWAGYGVPAICEFPNCKEEIDRGMSYACGGEPFSEIGCDRYFCSRHLQYECFKKDGSAGKCNHKRKCKCECFVVCARCAAGLVEPYPYKPEHPTWIKHVLNDDSWKEWRKKNPQEVEELKSQIKKR